MGKSKTVYEPGELDRVRKNLGEVDPDEARRIARILGGEVGYERALEESKAKKKREEARASGRDPGGAEGPDPGTGDRASGIRDDAPRARLAKETAGTGAKEARPADAALSYGQRLKMDFRCSQSDFLIKTQGQVIVTFLSFLPGLKDGVNPFFLTDILAETFKHLEILHAAARRLYPPRRADIQERLKAVPAFLRAMETLVSLDLGEISKELAALQQNPRSVEIPMLASLVKLVFRPLVRLKNAHAGFVLKAAAERALRASNEADPAALATLAEARDALLSELDYLFMNVAYRWYPLLMRLCGRKFREYSEFYEADEGRIHAFLGIRREDILPAVVFIPEEPPAPAKPESPDNGREEEAKKGEEAVEAIGQALDIGQLDELGKEERKENREPEIVIGKPKSEERSDPFPPSVRKGLNALESIFPESGLSKPDEHPDIYPYFHRLYPLPKGSDLIAPADSLLQVMILAFILNDLFHGFRSARWGMIQEGETEDLSEGVNAILNEWMSPCDEVIPKRYLPLLSEYCRLLETERESQHSTFASKRDADLLFYKKRYFLPHTKGTIFSGVQSTRDRDLKPLYKMSPLMKRYLSVAAQDVERAIKSRQEGGNYACVAVANPFDPVHVEVENLAIDRLRTLLKHEGPAPKKLTNAALIYYALNILEAFDYLVNSQESWAYRDERVLPYRSLEESKGIRLGAESDAEKAFQRHIDALIQARKSAAVYEKQARPIESAAAASEPARPPEAAGGESPAAPVRGKPPAEDAAPSADPGSAG
jgi:hypothetical protein